MENLALMDGLRDTHTIVKQGIQILSFRVVNMKSAGVPDKNFNLFGPAKILRISSTFCTF